MKKLVFFIIVVAALSYAAWYRIDKDSNKKVVEGVDKIQQKEGIPVRTVNVIQQDIFQTITLSGQISACSHSKVTSTVSERVIDVNCKTGQKVAKGDVLVTLDAKTVKLALLQARASQRQVARELQKLRNGSRPEEIQAAQADLENTESAYGITKIEYDRQSSLYKQEAATLQAFQDAESKFNQAKAAVKSAQAQFELIKQGPRQEDIQLGESALELAEIAVKQAEDRLNDHYIKAAFDGVVTKRLVDPGDIADFNMPLFELMDIDKVYLDLPVSELNISTVKVGNQISFLADSWPGRSFTGIVDEINPKADMSDRTFTVRVLINNPDHELLPGMFARAELVIDKAIEALVIPEASIHRDIDGKFVWVAEPGKIEIVETPEAAEGQTSEDIKPDAKTVDAIVARKKRLSTGIRSGDLIEVKSGLMPGEKVIEMGALLKENAHVILENGDQASEAVPENESLVK